VDVGNAALAILDDVVHHRTSELLAPGAGVVDEDRNEVQSAMKDLPGALLAPFAEFILASTVDEGRGSKDRFGTIHRQLELLVAGALVPIAALRAQLRKIEAFQALQPRAMDKERQMPVKRVAANSALASLD